MIAPVTPVQPVRPVYLKRDNHKITELPPETTITKPENKTWYKISPLICSVGFVLAVGLLRGCIGG